MLKLCRLAGVVPLLLSAAACGGDGGAGAQAAPFSESATVTVQPRDFVRRIRLTGLTEATRSYVVTTPLLTGGTRGALVVTRLAPAGAAVKTGDLLVQFDSQQQDKIALDKRAEYEDLVQQIRQKQAELEAARVKDESEVAQARNAVKNYELETLKNEMLSRVKAEKNDQDLAEARSKLDVLQEALALKRTAANAELRILEIKRDRAKADMDHALENARGMTVYSPLDGLVVPKLTWRGNGPADIQEGDEMWPGAPVLQVVNQASMQVKVRVNQSDLPLIQAGQTVLVRLDAYPDLVLPGRIAHIAPIALNGSFSNRVRVFNALVTIDGTNPRLLPDLTAAIDVELDRTRNALVVRRTAVEKDGEATRVRVRDANGVTARAVTLGPSDEVDVVVTSGLRAGDVVLQ